MPLSKRVPEAGAQTRIQRRDLGDRPQAMPSGLEDPARWCQLHRASRGNNSAGEEAPRSKAHSGVAQTRLSGRPYTHSSESRGRPGVIFSGALRSACLAAFAKPSVYAAKRSSCGLGAEECPTKIFYISFVCL